MEHRVASFGSCFPFTLPFPWQHIKKYAKSVVNNGFDHKRCIIVGTKADTKRSGDVDDDDESSIFVTKASMTNPEEAVDEYFQRKLGRNAFAFFECSAVSGEGVDEVFDNAFRLAIGDCGQRFKKLISAW